MKPGVTPTHMGSNPYHEALQGLAPGRMIDELKEWVTKKKREN